MKSISPCMPRFTTFLAFVLAAGTAWGEDYNWIAPDGRFWTGNSTQRADYYGVPTPPASGPTASDNLTITTVGTLNLQNSGGTLNGGNDRFINNVTSSVAGGNIASGQSTAFTSLTVEGNINLSTANTSLTLWNTGGNPVTNSGMTVVVNGNVNVGADTSLYIGVIRDTGTPTNVNNYLLGFTANNSNPGQGQINVAGNLMLNRRTTVASFGDFNIDSTGVVTLTGAGGTDKFDGTFDKTIQARSLAGSGILQNSIVEFDSDPSTSSAAVLQINTVASTDANFAGTLQDGSGTNASLAIEINGTGRQVFSGANTYSGGTVVNAGTLVANNTTGSATGSGAVNIADGAVLNGTGTIAGPVSVSGTVGAGNSIGTLTFGDTLTLNNGATIEFELLNSSSAGITYDLLVGTDLDLSGASSINLIVSGLDGHSIQLDDTFTIFSGDVSGFNASAFTIINNTDWTGGWALSEGSLTLTAIPEPSHVGALLVVLATSCVLIRRRKNRA